MYSDEEKTMQILEEDMLKENPTKETENVPQVGDLQTKLEYAKVKVVATAKTVASTTKRVAADAKARFLTAAGKDVTVSGETEVGSRAKVSEIFRNAGQKISETVPMVLGKVWGTIVKSTRHIKTGVAKGWNAIRTFDYRGFYDRNKNIIVFLAQTAGLVIADIVLSSFVSARIEAEAGKAMPDSRFLIYGFVSAVAVTIMLTRVIPRLLRSNLEDKLKKQSDSIPADTVIEMGQNEDKKE